MKDWRNGYANEYLHYRKFNRTMFTKKKCKKKIKGDRVTVFAKNNS